jgi:enterobactin synthetase component D
MNKLSLSPSDIPKLFPDFVVHTGIRYWELKTLPAEVPLPSRLKDAVWRRQADYVSGRLCAQEALNRLGAAALNVASGQDGCPVWPSGIVGSITHSNGFAFAAVAWESRARSLGLDTETLMSSATAKEIAPLITTPLEYQNLSRLPISEPLLTTIIFSVKETIFKCLYPLLKFRFDFTDVEVTAIDITSGSFRAIPKPSLSTPFFDPFHLAGSFVVIVNIIHTGLILPIS